MIIGVVIQVQATDAAIQAIATASGLEPLSCYWTIDNNKLYFAQDDSTLIDLTGAGVSGLTNDQVLFGDGGSIGQNAGLAVDNASGELILLINTANNNVTINAGQDIAGGGVNNVVIGAVLTAAANGSYNVIQGYLSGDSMAGSYNVANGFQAMDGYTGDSSVGVGYRALKDVTGTFNVAIGTNAGYDGGPQTYDNCTALGANSVIDGDNQISIGDSAVELLRIRNFNVDLTTAPTDGQVLVYNASTQKYEPGTVAGGGGLGGSITEDQIGYGDSSSEVTSSANFRVVPGTEHALEINKDQNSNVSINDTVIPTGASNVLINSGTVSTPTGSYNFLACGTLVGQSLNGSNNFAHGANSLRAGAGSNNVSFAGAGRSLTGSNNFLSGSDSGRNMTGDYCFAVGSYSGGQGTQDTCMFFGRYAGYYGSQSDSICLGDNTLYYTIGDDNIAIGFHAGEGAQGSNNTYLGERAGEANAGDHNIVFGADACQGDLVGAEEVTITDADIDDATDRLTGANIISMISAMGWQNGQVVGIEMVKDTGATLPAPLNTYRAIYLKATVNTGTGYLQLDWDLTDSGSGSFFITPRESFSQTVVFGEDAQPDASDQIVLGGPNQTETVFNTPVIRVQDTAGLPASSSDDTITHPTTGLAYAVGTILFDTATGDMYIKTSHVTNIWMKHSPSTF